MAATAALGCAPPPPVFGADGEPAIELVSPTSGVDVPLIRLGTDLFLDLQVVADVSGLAFVPPGEASEDVAGEGHFHFNVNGTFVSAPASRLFSYRSAANAFLPDDAVQLSVSLVSNTGEDLDGFDDWIDVVEFNVVAPVAPTAEVRFVNASPDAGPLDVYAAGTARPLYSDLDYGDATDWIQVDATPLRIELREAGASATSEPLLRDILDPTAGERTNAIASGFVAGRTGNTFRVLAVDEGWDNDVTGRARVRFVHTGPDLPTVQIDGVAAANLEVAPFRASEPEGALVDIDGGVQLSLFAADGGSEPITSFTTPELAEGDEILLIAAGERDALAREPDGLQLIAIGADGPLEPLLQDPQLYVLHGSADSPSLELCVGTQTVVANLLYGQMEPTRLSPGTYDLQIFRYPAGCTTGALNGTGNVSTFEAGERYLMLLTGEQTADDGEASIQAASFRDDFTLGDEDNARVRFVHGASYTQVYVGVVDQGSIVGENVLTAPIAWRVASREVTVGPGPVELGIADADGEPPPPYSPIVTFDYAAVGGERQWGIVAGDPSPDDAEDGGLQVLVVDSAPSPWTVALVDVQ